VLYHNENTDLTIRTGEITIKYSGGSEIIGGTITSQSGFISIDSEVDMNSNLYIYSTIRNYGQSNTGLIIRSDYNRKTYVALSGSQANTYTGATSVSGSQTELNLQKSNAAVSGDLTIRDSALVKTHARNQIKRRSTVSLISYTGNASPLRFVSRNYGNRNLQENIKCLVVEGKGVIDFGTEDSKTSHGIRYFYIDDLQVNSSGHLKILAWEEGRDHLLVRKDSKHLHDSLKRLAFEGYNPAT